MDCTVVQPGLPAGSGISAWPSPHAGSWNQPAALKMPTRVGSRDPVVWSDAHAGHEPGGEIYVGVRTAGHRGARACRANPRRPSRARGARRSRPRRTRTTRSPPSTTRSSSPTSPAPGRHWTASGLDRDPGQDRVVPYLFPHPGLLGGRSAPPSPRGDRGRAGPLRLRHDDPDRPRDLGGGARGGRRRAHRRRPRRGRRAGRPTRAAARRATT